MKHQSPPIISLFAFGLVGSACVDGVQDDAFVEDAEDYEDYEDSDGDEDDAASTGTEFEEPEDDTPLDSDGFELGAEIDIRDSARPRSKVDGGVEHLVQATFLACVENRDRFQGRSEFRGYRFGIARNILLDWYRRGRGPVDFETISIADLAPSPSQAIAGREQERLLLRALRRLPVDHQITLELYYWEPLEGHQLAAVLGISEHTVRSRLSRARTGLRDAIRQIADDPAQAQSTLDDLDAWVGALRERIDDEHGAGAGTGRPPVPRS